MRSIPACSVADVAAAARPFGMTLRQLVERSMQEAGRTELRRLYVGSSFCSQYFLRQPDALWREAFALCRAERIPATLVLPVFSQRDLSAAKVRICSLLAEFGTLIDEVTVNDIGMLAWLSEHIGLPVNAGRLFFKVPRDPRFAALQAEPLSVGVPALLGELGGLGKVNGVELDPVCAQLNVAELRGLAPGLTAGVHMLYCFLTTGNVCELASAQLPLERKFRPNAPCSLECARCVATHELREGVRLAKWGRTVFFANHDCSVCEGERFRMIVSPLDVLLPQPAKEDA